MTNPSFCFDVWTIRKLANEVFDHEYWHFNDNCESETFDEEYSTDSDDRINWKDYYYRKKGLDDSWNQYRNYDGLFVFIVLIIS
jgi:hypothetical protein